MGLRAYRVPGVYRRTRPRTAAFPRLRTDVAGFVGVAGPRHLHEPVRLDDWRDYEQAFLVDSRGTPTAPPPGSRLADEVRAFFANGGARCWVVNVAEAVDPARAVDLLHDLLGLPRPGAPVDAHGQPLPRGLEALLRLPDVALLVVPALFCTRARIRPRYTDDLPPRFEEGAFAPCRSFTDLDDVPEDQLPPALVDEALLFSTDQILAAHKAMLSRCDRAKWRVFLLLAPPPGLSSTEVVDWRERLGVWDGAALYWPWVLTQDVPGDHVLSRAPTGHVAGVLARSDLARGPHRAPAGERVVGIVGTENPVGNRVQSQVYPRGINVVRPVTGRGLQIWGARTLKFVGVGEAGREDSTADLLGYVNVRRGLSAVERTCERIGQKAVFEPNTALLRLQLQQAIGGYLTQLFDSGVLLGTTPEQAFVVRCDAALNPPELVEQGQLVCEVGVALGAPAEFVVFRIGRREGVVEIEEV